MSANLEQMIPIHHGARMANVNTSNPLDLTGDGGVHIDTSKFDGATYYFEIVALTTDTADRHVYLHDDAESLVATITVPSTATNLTRIRSGYFAPTTGNHTYHISIEAVSAGKKVQVTDSKMIIVQTSATKTVIMYPFISLKEDQVSDITVSGITWSSQTDSYQKSFTGGYSNVFKREDSKYASVIKYSFVATFSTNSAAHASYVKLVNITDSTDVIEFSTTSTTGETKIQDLTGLANWHNGDIYQVYAKQSNASYYVVMKDAHIEIEISPITKSRTFALIANYASSYSSGTYTYLNRRLKYEAANYSGPTVHLLSTSSENGTASTYTYYDCGTVDVSGSGSGGVVLTIAAGLQDTNWDETSITMVNNHRYFLDLALTTPPNTKSMWLVVDVVAPVTTESVISFMS